MLTFLGIGAQKAGTTWLYEQFRQHPHINFPKGKELHFWDRPHNYTTIHAYLDQFSGHPWHQGEITPAYAILPPNTIHMIWKLVPDVRLIYIIRNPIERAWSSALMALQRAELSFSEASNEWFLDHFYSSGSMMRGHYVNCINNWLQFFNADQLLILNFDQIKTQPELVLARCARHLNIKPFPPEVLETSHKPVFTGLGYKIRPPLHTALANLYRPILKDLGDLLNTDFSTWLQPLEEDVPKLTIRSHGGSSAWFGPLTD